MDNACNTLTSRHKITLDELICRKNQSIKQSNNRPRWNRVQKKKKSCSKNNGSKNENV